MRDAPQAGQLLVDVTHQPALTGGRPQGRVVGVLRLQAPEHLIHLPKVRTQSVPSTDTGQFLSLSHILRICMNFQKKKKIFVGSKRCLFQDPSRKHTGRIFSKTFIIRVCDSFHSTVKQRRKRKSYPRRKKIAFSYNYLHTKTVCLTSRMAFC